VDSVELLKLHSEKTVLVLMYVRSIHISVLRKPSGECHMCISTAFNLCLGTGSE